MLAIALVASAQTARADSEPSPEHATAVAVEGTAVSLAATGAGVWLVLGRGHDGGAHFLGITALALGPASLIVTPSLGHRYGTGSMRTTGLFIRIGGYGLVAGGLVLQVIDGLDFLFCNDSSCANTDHSGLAIAGIGAATMLLGAVYDIATAASDTAESNRVRRAQLRIAPIAILTPRDKLVAGLGIGGRF